MVPHFGYKLGRDRENKSMATPSVLRLWPLALILCTSGCGFGPTYPEGFLCSEVQSCPPGQDCDVDGVCRLRPMGSMADAPVPSVDAAPPDAALPDAAPPDAAPPDAAPPDGRPPECTGDPDCADDEFCSKGECVPRPPTCDDRRRNGTETDVDCGGDECPACGDGSTCEEGGDCTSGVCGEDLRCAAARCGDGVRNGEETCDTGGDTSGCDADCTRPECGDQHVNQARNEQCDDGNQQSGDGCNSTCRWELVFVGFAIWAQDATRQSDIQQDAAMDAACVQSFARTRAASMNELGSGSVVGLPPTNPLDEGDQYVFVTGACPGCVGAPRQGNVDGHDRNCVEPGNAFVPPYVNICFSNQVRGAACIFIGPPR